MNQAQRIQDVLRSRVADPAHTIITKEGVYAEINLEEGGLNAAEGSYGGVHPQTWDEYCTSYAQDVHNVQPADFENIPPETAALHIIRFKNWYFERPPKMNFWALPKLLWLVACDGAYLSGQPTVVARIQQLIGDPKPDGIWGSGTTKAVTEYFAEKTVLDIVDFARKLSESLIERYKDLDREWTPHWIERCKRKYETLLDYVESQSIEEEVPPEEAPVTETVERVAELATTEDRPSDLNPEVSEGVSEIKQFQPTFDAEGEMAKFNGRLETVTHYVMANAENIENLKNTASEMNDILHQLLETLSTSPIMTVYDKTNQEDAPPPVESAAPGIENAEQQETPPIIHEAAETEKEATSPLRAPDLGKLVDGKEKLRGLRKPL